MDNAGWVSVLPPVLAIVLAIWSKQVILSLFAGIWIGFTVLSGFNPLTGLTAGLDGVVNVFSDPADTRVLIFTLIIGALIATIEHSGGVRGFVYFLETRRWVHNGRRAQLLAWVTGLVIFIESNITLLVAGAISRPLFDRYRVSREKLAYIIDSTSAPVCIMIPINAWGAVVVGLVASTGVADPLGTFIAAIPYNLYAIFAILLSGGMILLNFDFGPMKAAEQRTRQGQLLWPGALPLVDVSAETPAPEEASAAVPSAALMAVPILAMILMMPIGMYLTGDGSITQGSGSVSILWAVCFALFASWVMILAGRKSTVSDLMVVFMKGAGALLPISAILLLALALGDVANLLGTGNYVANVVGDNIPAVWLAPLIFLTSAFIAFSVGSSWGTFAIMIPIAIPIAATLGLSIPLFLAAAMSGAIFGDHASPISDTTVVASMASATDHIDHVRTQLPYALLAAAFATAGFFLLGFTS
ncbi:MAG: sodium:proton antiporter [Woeseiaceae bacterium]|nr:sodium:proton antiporter [Woeseiaceae bacterium]